MLLCLVSDILDLKMIEQNKFSTRSEQFSPIEVFKFIVSIFKHQADMQKSSLSFEMVRSLKNPEQQ